MAHAIDPLGRPIEMTPKAKFARLKQACALSELCFKLNKYKPKLELTPIQGDDRAQKNSR